MKRRKAEKKPKGKFYFLEYDVCKCGYIQHYEKFKRWSWEWTEPKKELRLF